MRARNIKPGFYTNDALAELPPLTRLLFTGLWCLADRAGRLEDRPKKIKAEILPYDDCDAQAMLDALQTAGFITRYTVDGTPYIQVTNFLKHQNPHIREPQSTIPAPPDGAPDQHSASTVLAPDAHEDSPADSGYRIPDTGLKEPQRAGTDTASSIETSATPAEADPAPPAAVEDDPMPAGRPYLAQFVSRVWQPLFPMSPLLPTTYSVDGERLDGLERALAPFARLPGGVEALCDELAHRIGPGGEASISGLRMQFEEMITAKNRRWHERAVRYLTGTITGIFEEVSQHGQSHQHHQHGAKRRGRQGAPGADSRGRHTPEPVRTDHGAAGYGGWA